MFRCYLKYDPSSYYELIKSDQKRPKISHKEKINNKPITFTEEHFLR
jgi:hypothetical protein